MAQHQTTVVIAPTQPAVQTAVVVHKKEGNACRAAIPAMPMAMAVLCLLFNIFVPGFGTIIAGFTVFCCGNPGQSGCGKCGWIWSIMWGVAFIGMSHDYKQTRKTTTTLVTTRNPGPQAVTITQTPQQQPYYQQQPPPAQPGYPPPQQGYPPPQQGYAPPPQQGYAPPPQQGYAPPPQQGYAPPSHHGYAPVPQQGYAPPLQGSAPPVESNSPPQNYPPQPAYNPYDQSQQPPPYTDSGIPPKKS